MRWAVLTLLNPSDALPTDRRLSSPCEVGRVGCPKRLSVRDGGVSQCAEWMAVCDPGTQAEMIDIWASRRTRRTGQQMLGSSTSSPKSYWRKRPRLKYGYHAHLPTKQ